MSALFDRVAHVKGTIAEACKRANRSPAEVKLVAVTKTVPTDIIAQAYGAGLRVFGENRVQEAQPKIGALPADIEWHFIGHLQSNKARAAAGLFDLIHSVDSVRLGRRLAARAAAGQSIRMLLQVNLTGKTSQSGFAPEEVGAAVAALAGESGVALEGLMTIAPQVTDREAVRPWFRQLADLYRDLAATAAGHPWRHLSMGMTEDYPIAIEEGATLVRVGRALFGERPA